jgi:hypothetical protein
MSYIQRKSNNKADRNCTECGMSFIPRNNGGVYKFCSRKCANAHRWKNHVAKPKKVQIKKCKQCNGEFTRQDNYSDVQWLRMQFCSAKCVGESRRLHDGLTRQERYRAKRGGLKIGSDELRDKIKITTRIGMSSPDVKLKLSKPKGKWSDERKGIQSQKLTGKMPKNLIRQGSGTGSYPNVQRGDYECSKGTMYFRSKWEANYALYLDLLVKNGDIRGWDYEVDVFVFEEIEFGNRSYRPDFKVQLNSESFEYHEVKGHMDSRSKTKLNRMEKFFPDVKIILIQKDSYNAIIKALKGVINFY